MFWSLDHFSGCLFLFASFQKLRYPLVRFVAISQVASYDFIGWLSWPLRRMMTGWDSTPNLRLKMMGKKKHGENPKSPGLILLKSPLKTVINWLPQFIPCGIDPNRSMSLMVSWLLGSWLSSVPCSSPSLCLSLYLRAEVFESDHHLGFLSHGDTANSSKSLDQYIHIYIYYI